VQSRLRRPLLFQLVGERGEINKVTGRVVTRGGVICFLSLVRLGDTIGSFPTCLCQRDKNFDFQQMDAPLAPPVRLQATSSSPIPTKNAQKRIAAFLDDFEARSISSGGPNTAVTVQLQKLEDALREERKQKRVV
jgi:hypothetical protein